MISLDRLRRFAPSLKDPEIHANALEAARRQSSVTTPRRLCHFLGQVYVETAKFTAFVENLNYRTPQRLDALFSAVRGTVDARELIRRGPEAIANRVYSNRNGNGNEASGDGWRFRGSGYVQLTGRDNYRRIGQLIRMDLELNPEWARTPETAARIAFAYWDAQGCSTDADEGDTEGVTEKINGAAKAHLAERRAATLRALGIWRD